MKNKKWIKYLFFTIIILAIIIIALVFIFNKSNNKTSSIQEKLKDEFKYLDDTTLSMVNSLNNLSTSNLVKIEKTSTSSSQSTQNNESSQGSKTSDTGGESYSDGEDSKSSSSESQRGGETDSKNIQTYTIKNNSIILKDKNSIDWEELESQAENLFHSWTTMTLDLNTANVSSSNILEYNSNLDNLLISIKKQDKTNTAICLANLYSLIPRYMEETSSTEEETKIEKVKSNVVSAYSIVENDDWNSVNKFLGQAEADLTSLINYSSSSKETKQAGLNKSYVLLKELIKSSNEKNVDLFYLKYINLIAELEKI